MLPWIDDGRRQPSAATARIILKGETKRAVTKVMEWERKGEGVVPVVELEVVEGLGVADGWRWVLRHQRQVSIATKTLLGAGM